MAAFDLDAAIGADERQYGIPAGLYGRLINRGEHSGPYAVSPKGAIGYAQLLPTTAKDMGVDPWNPEQNLQGGAKYLAMLLKRYHGDQARAVAAYNEGMGNLEKGNMPAETQKYVSNVLGGGMTPGGMAGQNGAFDVQGALNQVQNDPLIKEVEKQSRDAAKASDEYATQLKADLPKWDELQKSWANSKSPHLPKSEAAPEENLPAVQEPITALQKFMPLLIMLGGSVNKHLGMASLRAATAAMKGQQSGELAVRDKAHEDWIDKTKIWTEKHAQDLEEWRALMEEHADNRQGLINAASVLASKHGDMASYAAASKGSVEDLAGILKTKYDAQRSVAEILRASIEAGNVGMNRDPVKEAYHKAILSGKTPEEAASEAGKISVAVHPEIKIRTEERVNHEFETKPEYKAAEKVIDSEPMISRLQSRFEAAQKEHRGGNLDPADQGLLIDKFVQAASGRSTTGYNTKLMKDAQTFGDDLGAARQHWMGKGGQMGPELVSEMLRDYRELVGDAHNYTTRIEAEKKARVNALLQGYAMDGTAPVDDTAAATTHPDFPGFSATVRK